MKIVWHKKLLESHFLTWLSFVVLLGSIAVAIQFFIIPRVFVSLEKIPGLLLDGDWEAFHLSAIETAEFLKVNGWRAWSPFRGILGPTPNVIAPFYRLFGPKPWVFIPLSVMVHAASGLILFLILKKFSRNSFWAYLGALVFILFPSGTIAYAQLHKDAFGILGFFLVLYSWLQIWDLRMGEPKLREYLLPLTLNYLGSALTWLMRTHQSKVLFVAQSALLPVLLYWHWHKEKGSARALSRLFISGLLLIYFSVSFPYLRDYAISVPETFVMSNQGKKIGTQVSQHWNETKFIPKILDNQFKTLAIVRRGCIFYGRWGTTSLDLDVNFHSAKDVVGYLPRALQIGLLAPFPSQWFKFGPHPTSRVFSFFGSLEAILFYLVFPFFLYLVVRKAFRPDLWIVLFITLASILSHSIVVLNVGTLHRQRFGYWILLLGLGISGLSWALQEGKEKLRKAIFRKHPEFQVN